MIPEYSRDTKKAEKGNERNRTQEGQGPERWLRILLLQRTPCMLGVPRILGDLQRSVTLTPGGSLPLASVGTTLANMYLNTDTYTYM